MAAKPRGETSGYDLKTNKCGNTGTLWQLQARGLCRPVGQGHMAMPQSATWQITPAGRDEAASLTA